MSNISLFGQIIQKLDRSIFKRIVKQINIKKDWIVQGKRI